MPVRVIYSNKTLPVVFTNITQCDRPLANISDARRICHPPPKRYLHSMKQRIANVTLVVRDYDEAIAYYTRKLNFDLIEDTPLTPEKRWVLVAPKGSSETRLLLAKADDEQQQAAIGHQ